MSFLLHLTENGVYIKECGEPLEPRQEVMFKDDVYYLPDHYEDELGAILVARKWRIPTERGHYLLIEYLAIAKSGWPWA